MIDEQMKTELLSSINKSIIEQSRRNIIIASAANMNQITSISSGSLKINPAAVKRFRLILEQPLSQAFSPFEIRCCLCHRVISYPCWHYEVKYAVNHFHYFICFDKNSTDKPSTKCYRKG